MTVASGSVVFDADLRRIHSPTLLTRLSCVRYRMSSKTALLLLVWPLLGVLGACGMVNSPQPGMYRAVISLAGGEVPMQLRIDKMDAAKNLAVQLFVVEGEASVPATDLQINGNELRATLPGELGVLKVQFDRNSLHGELQLAAVAGKPLAFPVTARRGENYRFFKTAATDNADISGGWRVQVLNDSMPLALIQTHDGVDGSLHVQDKSCDITGQIHNDDVYLAGFCKWQLMLFKGSVNKEGELAGDFWQNNQPSQYWHARRSNEVIEPQTDNRPVKLPWAVPTR